MTKFVNYSKDSGLSIRTFRNPCATICDVWDISRAISLDADECITCALDEDAVAELKNLPELAESIRALLFAQQN